MKQIGNWQADKGETVEFRRPGGGRWEVRMNTEGMLIVYSRSLNGNLVVHNREGQHGEAATYCKVPKE